MTRVLIVGGYGTFGARLARLLAEDGRLTLILAGRSQSKAQALCASLPAGAGREALAFDREGEVEAAIAAARPDVVVDAAGPFQLYGADPYRLARACLAAGADYLDLADAAGFVEGIGTLDVQAKAAGRVALSGLSTFPALSAAVIERIGADLDVVRSVSAGVAPSPWAGVGLSVVRAVSSYAGKRLPLIRGGRPAHGRGLIDSRRRTIAPPGAMPMHSLRFSLAETADLTARSGVLEGVETRWTGAGPQPPLLHDLLSLAARLVRWRLLPSLEPFARLFHWGTRTFRWGERRGGMFVEIEGSRDAEIVRRSWHLIAEGDDGPNVPVIGAAAVIRRLADGVRPEPGAHPASGAVSLAEYEAVFSTLAITTGVRDEAQEGPLYARVLGSAWRDLPAPIRAMHDLAGEKVVRGEAEVERGRGPLAWLFATVMGLPRAGRDVPVEVRFSEERGGELWRRTFAGRSFRSFQEEGRGRNAHLVVERFGPVAVGMAAVVEGERLRLVIRRATLFGIPLPAFLRPSAGDTCERVDEHGRFRFEVEIVAPIPGLLVRYRGWLA